MSWHHARCQGLQTFSLYSVLESVCGGQLIPTSNQGCSVALEPARPSSAGQCEALPKLPNCQRQHIWSLKQARAGGLTLQKMANATDQDFPRPRPFQRVVVKHLPAHHWLYAVKIFFKGINLHFGNYLWTRVKERLKYREGKEAKERSAKRLLTRP